MEDFRDLSALWVVANEYDRGLFGRVIMRIVIGLNSCADRLKDQCMVFSGNSDMAFGAEHGLS